MAGCVNFRRMPDQRATKTSATWCERRDDVQKLAARRSLYFLSIVLTICCFLPSLTDSTCRPSVLAAVALGIGEKFEEATAQQLVVWIALWAMAMGLVRQTVIVTDST